MARDMGPNCEVPAMRAGGAVELPLPSTCTLTFGYIFKKASAQSVIMLFIVSEPTLFRLPETPEVFWYDGRPASTLSAWAEAMVALSATTTAAPIKRFMYKSSICMRPFPTAHASNRLETARYTTVNSPLI